MIGYNKKPIGQMGNRLFHYNFLHQVAYKAKQEIFHPSLKDKDVFKRMEARKKRLSLFKKNIYINSKMVVANPKALFACIENAGKDSVNVIFEPPMLGETFFDFLFVNPNTFISFKDGICDTRDMSKNTYWIGAHFRGTDFAKWDKKAILPFSYYKKSIEHCIKEVPNMKVKIILFTDDYKLKSYNQTLYFLEKEGIPYEIGDAHSPATHDFCRMSKCDILISSPSTFSIWAGILGKKKKIIHSKEWMAYRIQANDKFWIDLEKSSSPFYKLWNKF